MSCPHPGGPAGDPALAAARIISVRAPATGSISPPIRLTGYHACGGYPIAGWQQ